MIPRASTPDIPMVKEIPEPPEVVVVNDTHVACDGVGGGLGHPKVYMQIGEEDFVDCGYCDRRFVLSEKARLARANGELPSH
jgi:uncharacterized Zn-finger protein